MGLYLGGTCTWGTGGGAFRWGHKEWGPTRGPSQGGASDGARSAAQPRSAHAAVPWRACRPHPAPAPLPLLLPRAMRFDPEGATSARQHSQQQQPGTYAGAAGAYAGSAGAYGGGTTPWAGPTGAHAGQPGAYAGRTGGFHAGPYAGAAGPYAGPTGYGAARGGGGAGGPPAEPVDLKTCGAEPLLDCLPRLQKLLLRTMACVPEGAAAGHPLCLVRGGRGPGQPGCAAAADDRQPACLPSEGEALQLRKMQRVPQPLLAAAARRAPRVPPIRAWPS